MRERIRGFWKLSPVNKVFHKDNSLLAELKENTRLQWMLLAIGVILVLSVTKSFSDANKELHGDIQTKLALLERLQAAVSEEIPAETIDLISNNASEINSTIPEVQSVSVAEAEALSAVGKLTSDVIDDGRASLIGSEDINYGGRDFWQVRVEFKGKMDQRALTKLLTLFDGSRPQVRVISLRFQPNSNGNIGLVLDFLYRKNAS